MDDVQLVNKAKAIDTHLMQYVSLGQQLLNRSRMLHPGEKKFTENGITITDEENRLGVSIENGLRIKFDYDNDDKIARVIFMGDKPGILFDQCISFDQCILQGIIPGMRPGYSMSEKSKEEIKKILTKCNSDNIEEVVKCFIEQNNLEIDDKEVKALFDSLKKEFSVLHKVKDSVNRFNERSPKDQIRRISLYEKMLEDIKERLRLGRETGQDYEEIYADIIKRLGFKDTTMLFAFVEYAKQCVDQKIKISDKYKLQDDLRKNGNRLNEYRLMGAMTDNPVVKKTKRAINNFLEDINEER